MPLTEEEKVRIRLHLGYPIQGTLAAMFSGLPYLDQSLWQLEAIMATRLKEETLPVIRTVLKQLDDILFIDFPDARLEHKAEQLEELRLNMKHTVMLSQDYVMWQKLLAQCFSVPINPDMDGVGKAYSSVRNFSVG